jgi:ABC-type lipopolysaccharide export system ATPase subunit
MTHTLEADGIQLTFEEKRILSDIYIRCETGKITGLLGRNGEGKSCLMKIIYGTLQADKSVRFDNTSQYHLYKRPDLALFLPQFHFIPRGLSLKKIFADFGLDYSVFAKRFPEFSGHYRSSIERLPGGGARLVEIYIIARSKSHFALLDEPFTHISPLQTEKVIELLVEEKASKGFLITDHMYMHVTEMADQLYLLSGGKTHLLKNAGEIETWGYAKLRD